MSFASSLKTLKGLIVDKIKIGNVSAQVCAALINANKGSLAHYVDPNGALVPAPGMGGTVTQITSSSTGVTLSKNVGRITTVALTTAAGAEEVFTVTNTLVGVNDIPIVATTYAGAGVAVVTVKKVAAGAFDVVITNLHASAAFNAAVVINFKIEKGAVA